MINNTIFSGQINWQYFCLPRVLLSVLPAKCVNIYFVDNGAPYLCSFLFISFIIGQWDYVNKPDQDMIAQYVLFSAILTISYQVFLFFYDKTANAQ